MLDEVWELIKRKTKEIEGEREGTVRERVGEEKEEKKWVRREKRRKGHHRLIKAQSFLHKI